MSDRTSSPAQAAQASASSLYVITHHRRKYHCHRSRKQNASCSRRRTPPISVLRQRAQAGMGQCTRRQAHRPQERGPQYLHYLSAIPIHPQIDTSSDLETLADTYVLGEMLMDLEFQDVVLDILMYECEKRKHYADMVLIKIIHNGTTDGSPAQKLLVDLYYWGGPAT
jgi:hypothetical protein